MKLVRYSIFDIQYRISRCFIFEIQINWSSSIFFKYTDKYKNRTLQTNFYRYQTSRIFLNYVLNYASLIFHNQTRCTHNFFPAHQHLMNFKYVVGHYKSSLPMNFNQGPMSSIFLMRPWNTPVWYSKTNSLRS